MSLTAGSFDAENLRLLRASFERIWPHDDAVRQHRRLLKHFYKSFFTQCPHAKPHFADADMRSQRRMLFAALKSVVYSLEDREKTVQYLTELKDRHAQYEISAAHYAIFLQCLMEAIREADADDWTAEIEAQWRLAFEFIHSCMA